MRAVYITDTHFRGVNPRGRRDDYREALTAKFRWVVNYATARHIKLILHGGDWFDRWDADHGVVRDVQDILLPYVRSGGRVISTYGSHDCQGYNDITLKRSAVGALEGSGMATILRRGEFVVIDNVTIVSVPHSAGLDGGPGYYYIGEKDHFYRSQHARTILLAHGTLVDTPKPDGFDFTLISEARVNADLVLSGDYHPGYATYVRAADGVVFANPGSLARNTATANNRVRTPSILDIDIIDGAPVGVTRVPILCAADGADVFTDVVPTDPPDDGGIRDLVAYMRSQSDESDQFDPIDLVNRLPATNFSAEDQEFLEEARSWTVKTLQRMART